jgi:hypothetical protein
MARGFQKGCKLPSHIKDVVLRRSGSRPDEGTCNTCKKMGEITQEYRDVPCPQIQWRHVYLKYLKA